jgi:Acyl-CoA reductase (LuxC)
VPVSRDPEARVADVRRLLAAGAALYADRTRLAPDIARSTGLSLEGVELGFQSLEREATDADLVQLVARAGTADQVHVILAGNAFVAPLRAVAIARAAAGRVTIRPSHADPVLTRALVEGAADDGLTLTAERDVSRIGADQIHVYGRSESIAAVRAAAGRSVLVLGHGPGMGVAIVTRTADPTEAAELLCADVVAFDQRGCLSPRVAIVVGDHASAHRFAEALDERLAVWARRVPRGVLFDDERAAAARWRDAMAFAGRVWEGSQSTVALAPPGTPLAVPPPGRHVHVVSEPSLESAAARLAHVASFVVAVGTDAPSLVAAFVPPHARVSRLGEMQRPRLDGPVDARTSARDGPLRRRSCPG